jgi:hypothetical protein
VPWWQCPGHGDRPGHDGPRHRRHHLKDGESECDDDASESSEYESESCLNLKRMRRND